MRKEIQGTSEQTPGLWETEGQTPLLKTSTSRERILSGDWPPGTTGSATPPLSAMSFHHMLLSAENHAYGLLLSRYCVPGSLVGQAVIPTT